jgi:type I restriction enzyme R subunit
LPRTDRDLNSASVVLLSSSAARPTVKRSCIVASSSVKLRTTQQYSSDGPLALFDLLQKDGLDKTSRERLKQASRELLASITARLAELDRFWEKEQTKADVEVFILDEVFAKLPTPPFTAEEKKAVADSVYAHVWQRAMNGGLGKAA